ECRAAVMHLVPDCRWKSSGTLVSWSSLYRVGQSHADPAGHAQKLLRRLTNHLSVAFHRFLDGAPRKVAITLDIFDRKANAPGIPLALDGLDPFGYPRSGHQLFPATMLLEEGYRDRIAV